MLDCYKSFFRYLFVLILACKFEFELAKNLKNYISIII